MANSKIPGPSSGFLWTSIPIQSLSRTISQPPGPVNDRPRRNLHSLLVVGGFGKKDTTSGYLKEISKGTATRAKQFILNMDKELNDLNIQSDIDEIALNCYLNNTSNEVCLLKGMGHGVGWVFDVVDPRTPLKAALLSLVMSMQQEGEIDAAQVIELRSAITLSFMASDIKSLRKHWKDLKNAHSRFQQFGRNTYKNSPDMRYNVSKRLVEKLDEAWNGVIGNFAKNIAPGETKKAD